jgi:hypothetical protein
MSPKKKSAKSVRYSPHRLLVRVMLAIVAGFVAVGTSSAQNDPLFDATPPFSGAAELASPSEFASAPDKVANTPAPRIVFFTDFFLFSAQQDVVIMGRQERLALGDVLDHCPGTLALDQTLLMKCELARQQFSVSYHRGRDIDRLLGAVQFMTTLFRLNAAIGRQSEAGIDQRLGVVRAGLKDAIELAPFSSRRQ